MVAERVGRADRVRVVRVDRVRVGRAGVEEAVVDKMVDKMVAPAVVRAEGVEAEEQEEEEAEVEAEARAGVVPASKIRVVATAQRTWRWPPKAGPPDFL